MRQWVRSASVLSAWLIAVACCAQDATPTFRTGVQLVDLAVSVRDGNGKLVRDLNASDFRLREDGEERRIDLFTAPVSSASREEATQHLPPGVYSNAPELNRDSRGIVMVLIDSLNTCIPDQMQAKRQIVDFLRDLPPNQRLALYSVGMQFQVLHDFTSDPELLIARLNRTGLGPADVAATEASDGSGAQLLDGRHDTFRQAPLAEQELRAWFDQQRTLNNNAQHDIRVRSSINALEGIAQSVAHLPGKKTLLWLSGGFQELLGQPDLTPTRGRVQVANRTDELFNSAEAFQKALAAANRAGLTIYTVDSRGVAPQGDISPAVCDGIHAGVKLANQQVLREAAVATGGRAFVNSNDLRGALREAFEDIESTYTLGFYVGDGEAPRRRGRQQDAARRVEVSVRRPGLRVAHRRSYTAEGSRARGSSQDAARQALSSPVDSTGLVFLAALMPAESASGARVVQTVIPTAQLQFEERNGSFSTVVRMMVAPRAADGKPSTARSHTLRATLNEQQMEQARQTGLVLRQEVSLPANAIGLRVVLTEPALGLMGSLTLPVPRP
ncbi:MAG: VWA domain-containing protein [Bryobacterales bacterium]|nr:VWA domain-containing protein [Bryobacterales bacterium]